MSTKPVMVVVVPARPPIDKILACKRVQLDRHDEYCLIVEFCDVNEPTPANLAVWSRMCSPECTPYLLDVGEKKYHKLGSSAAEVEKMLSDTENARIYNSLVDLINENNRNGFLKNQKHSIAKLIRETYHVMNSGNFSQGLVFDHGMDVVDAFFFIKNKREWSALANDPAYSKLKKLWDGFGATEDPAPFTLPLYFKQLFMSGRSEAEIQEKIGWWLDKAKRVARAQTEAKSKEYECKTFPINGKSAGLVRVQNYFEACAAQYRWTGSGKIAVGIFRNELGQVHIKTSFKDKGINLKTLFDFLNQYEPGLWYYEDRFNKSQSSMLMNGSSQFYGVPATRFSDNQLIRAAVKFIKFVSQP